MKSIFRILADVIAVLLLVGAGTGLYFTYGNPTAYASLAGVIDLHTALLMIAVAFIVYLCGNLVISLTYRLDKISGAVNHLGFSSSYSKDIENVGVGIRAELINSYELIGGRLDDIRASIDYMSGWDGSNPQPITVENNVNDRREEVVKEEESQEVSKDPFLDEELSEKKEITYWDDAVAHPENDHRYRPAQRAVVQAIRASKQQEAEKASIEE